MIGKVTYQISRWEVKQELSYVSLKLKKWIHIQEFGYGYISKSLALRDYIALTQYLSRVSALAIQIDIPNFIT